MNHRGTMTIDAGRMVLRRLSIKDAEDMYYTWASDPEVTRYLTWLPHTSVEASRSVLRAWEASYKRLDFYQWGIELDGKLIGTIGGHSLNELMRAIEVGYVLAKPYWGMGIMTQALSQVLPYLFACGFNRIVAVHHIDNPASGRVMEKNGMTFEGIIRQGGIDARGNYHDIKQYSILASDVYGS